MPRFRTPYLTTILLCGALVTVSNGVYAQNGATDSGATDSTPPGASVMVPQRGMSMEAVQTQFGVPSAQLPPVGEPPIARWVYDGFTVYFEHHYVIHAVPNQ